jgi:propionyl-CoA carboxylase beta chain
MASKHIRADMNFAFPSAEIAVMGPEGAVNIVFRGELARIKDPAERENARARFISEYRERFANPYKAASLGYIDQVIRPRDTRASIIRALATLANKRQDNPPRKHGNIPL